MSHDTSHAETVSCTHGKGPLERLGKNFGELVSGSDMLKIKIVALDEVKNKVRAHIDVLISANVFYVACPCNCCSVVLLRRRGPLWRKTELGTKATKPMYIKCD